MSFIIKTILYQPLYNLLIFWAWLIPGHSLGWAIVALTLVVRLILLPSSLKAARAQARIQALQPKINQIRRQYKDQMEQSKALMALYKEEGVSQFGACLPMLIQFPILIVLYSVFRHSLDISNYSQLYAFTPRPDSLNIFFFGLDVSKPEMWVLPVLAAASQWYLSHLTMAKAAPADTGAPDPTQTMMKQMNYILPLMTFFFGRMFPAAISIYWVLTTVISVIQQLYVNKHIRSEKLKVKSEKPVSIIKELKDSDIKQEVERPQKKRDLMTRMMARKLDKQEKKTGVEVTIRTKK